MLSPFFRASPTSSHNRKSRRNPRRTLAPHLIHHMVASLSPAWSRRRQRNRGSLSSSRDSRAPCNLVSPSAGLADREDRCKTRMSVVDDVTHAIADAMRTRDAPRLSALRMLKAALMNREVAKGQALDDAEARQVAMTLIKQRKDSIEQFLKGGREDLAKREAAEIDVLQTYVPAAADAATIERAVADAIAETGSTSAKDLGRVMKAVMAKLAGQTIDGKAVNELVRQKLTS